MVAVAAAASAWAAFLPYQTITHREREKTGRPREKSDLKREREIRLGSKLIGCKYVDIKVSEASERNRTTYRWRQRRA